MQPPPTPSIFSKVRCTTFERVPIFSGVVTRPNVVALPIRTSTVLLNVTPASAQDIDELRQPDFFKFLSIFIVAIFSRRHVGWNTVLTLE